MGPDPPWRVFLGSSQPQAVVNIPFRDTRSQFNIRYFDRDTRRAPDQTLTIGTDMKLLASSEVA